MFPFITRIVLLLLTLTVGVSRGYAFQVRYSSRRVAQALPTISSPRHCSTSTFTKYKLYGFLGDKERETLTRDSEPEDYFAT
jgi:hypothetical protein